MKPLPKCKEKDMLGQTNKGQKNPRFLYNIFYKNISGAFSRSY